MTININKDKQIKTLANALFARDKETIYSDFKTQIDFDIDDSEVLVAENYRQDWTVYRRARTMSLEELAENANIYIGFNISKKEALRIAEELYNHFLNSVMLFIL